MLAQARDLASGSFVPSNPSIVGCRTRAGCHIFTCEQFRGRAVQASRDSLSGALFICIEVSQSFRTLPVAQILNYFPASFVTMGTSSLFPDDKLR